MSAVWALRNQETFACVWTTCPKLLCATLSRNSVFNIILCFSLFRCLFRKSLPMIYCYWRA